MSQNLGLYLTNTTNRDKMISRSVNETGKGESFLETVRFKNKLDHGSDINKLDLSYLKPSLGRNYQDLIREKRRK
jgi:hypothetical protein